MSEFIDADGHRVWPLTGRRGIDCWKRQRNLERNGVDCAGMHARTIKISWDREIAFEVT